MITRLTRRTRWWLIAGAMFVSAAGPVRESAAQDTTVRAASSTGGVVRGDRWTPLIVTVESTRAAVSGELRLTWGDAAMRRPIVLASAGRRQFEFLLRTQEPEATVRVDLVSGGQRVHSTEVAVRVLRPDEPFTLCVMSADGSIPQETCTATVASDRLPNSVRGYEAVDAVVWDKDTRLEPEQRAALEQWHALRELERSGDLGLAPQPVRPNVRRGLPAPATELVALLATAYVAGLLLVGIIVVSRRRVGLRAAAAMIAAVVAAGAATAHALGRTGPASAVRVHHASVLHQVPGSGVSILSMRGVIEFPEFDEFVVRLPLRDGTMEPATARVRAEQRVDDNGLAVITGTHGLGARQAFSAEGVVELHPLALTRNGDTTTVVNGSDLTLRACRFADGFSTSDVGTMPPGAAATARQVSDVIGPAFTCATDTPVVALTSPERSMHVQGSTFIAAYQDRPQAVHADD